MYSVQNSFDKDKNALAEQYIKAWHNENCFNRIEKLRHATLQLADTLANEAHPIIKAKCFAYILEHANVYINPDDWFGIALEAAKMSPILDTGCPYGVIIKYLCPKWTDEISDKLYPEKDKSFINGAKRYLLDEFTIDYNHSTPSWEDVFRLGIKGLLERAREYRGSLAPLSKKQNDYFDGIEITYGAIISLLKRYADELAGRCEARLSFMKSAVENLIDSPPKNTYEALLLSWIYWQLAEQVDGIRARSLGGLDVLYLDFYRRDIDSGLFTREDVEEMFTYYFHAFYSMRAHYQQPAYLGGMDEQGDSVVSDFTYLVLSAYNKSGVTNPKLQIKISKNTPERFLRLTLETVRRGNSSISIMNDDNAVAALLRLGVSREEAYTSLMSGCWDFAVKNHEVKTIPVRMSLPKVLEYTLNDGYCLNTGERVGCEVGRDFSTFDDFFAAFKRQLIYLWQRTKGIIENWELYLEVISPSSLYSGTVTDSLSRGVDGYARGMKYNNTVLSIAGLASLVDGLCAIKKFVFDKKEVTLSELNGILKSDWKDNLSLQKRILHDSDKYGNGSQLADGIMLKITDLLSKEVNLAPNSRGGVWKLGLLSIDKHVRWGSVTGATADGRCAGEPFSKNLSPVVGMDRGGITTLMRSVGKMDFKSFSHAGMLDLVLHPTAVSGEDGLTAFCALVRSYFAEGGHSLQFNVFSSETLKDAQANPEKYKTLQVRVCGWNVYFVELERVIQDEFIKQCEHGEGLL